METHLDIRQFFDRVALSVVRSYPSLPKLRFRPKVPLPRCPTRVPRWAEDIVKLLLQLRMIPPPEQERPKDDGSRDYQEQEKGGQERESARTSVSSTVFGALLGGVQIE